jgi:hypothetical protein
MKDPSIVLWLFLVGLGCLGCISFIFNYNTKLILLFYTAKFLDNYFYKAMDISEVGKRKGDQNPCDFG